MEQQQAERLESLKAGLISGLTVAIAYLGLAIAFSITDMIKGNGESALAVSLFGGLSGWLTLLPVASAGVSGFLFGVTYRYAVRQDQNPQLKAGVVMAFGMVRAISQIELGLVLHAAPTALAVLVVESLARFAIAALMLDWAIARRFIQPMLSLKDQ